MKKLLIISIIGLFPSIIFEQEKKINCDDLARHIEGRIWWIEHYGDGSDAGVFYNKDKNGLKRLAVHYRIKTNQPPTHFWSIDCKAAGEQNNQDASDKLFDSIAQFKQFQKALDQSGENSGTSCPEALHTLKMLQEKMEMYSQCIALFKEGQASQAAALKKYEEAKAKREAFDKFINEVNKK